METQPNTVKLVQMILCTKSTRGDGKNTPIRQITEVYHPGGDLAATSDIYTVTLEEIRQCYAGGVDSLTMGALLEKLGLPMPGQSR